MNICWNLYQQNEYKRENSIEYTDNFNYRNLNSEQKCTAKDFRDGYANQHFKEINNLYI
jgi:hypothetical protein